MIKDRIPLRTIKCLTPAFITNYNEQTKSNMVLNQETIIYDDRF